MEISVKGIPPKKRLDVSPWGNDVEVSRVIELRRSALTSFGNHAPFNSRIRLRISLFLTAKEFTSKNIGDLDNFVSGICDTLQAAKNNTKIHHSFELSDNQDVDPTKAIAIENDSAVVSIVADKFLLQPHEQSHYTVILDGE